MISLTNRSTRLAVFALLVYAVMVALAVTCLVIRRDALAFHPRDYNYFIEQAARLTDPLMSKRFASNIEGFNMLGLQGIEGSRSLVQAIHTDYFRYVYVLLYGLFHSTLLIYLVYSLIYFSPLLYISLIPRPRPYNRLQVIAFILLFIAFPATMHAVTSDLRPRMLFSAAWCLAVLSVYFDRPFLEKLVLISFLIALREEGVLLGATVIVMNHIHMQGQPQRWKQTLALALIDLTVLVLFLAFMQWGGYTRIDTGLSPFTIIPEVLSRWPAPVLLGALVGLAGFGWLWRKFPGRRGLFVVLLAYTAALGMTGLQVLRDAMQWQKTMQVTGPVSGLDLYVRIFTEPATTLFFYLAILLAALVLDFPRPRARAWISAGLLALAALFAATSLATFLPQVSAWRQNIAEARLVWQFVESHDRYQTNVLLDYNTYQAFYHFDRVLVYNRLPMWLVNPVPENRFYPQNKSLIVREIQQRMEYAVVARESQAAISEMALLAGVPVEEIAGNQRYVILRLR